MKKSTYYSLRTVPIACPGYGIGTMTPCPNKEMLVNCPMIRQRCPDCAKKRNQMILKFHNDKMKVAPDQPKSKEERPQYPRVHIRTEPLLCAGYGVDQLVPCRDQVMLVDCPRTKLRCANCARQHDVAKSRAYWYRHHPNAMPREPRRVRPDESQPEQVKALEPKDISPDRLEEVDLYFPGRGELMRLALGAGLLKLKTEAHP